MISEYKKITGIDLTDKQYSFLVRNRYALFVFIIIKKHRSTYLSKIEKVFIEHGSRNTLIKCIQSLKLLNLIKIEKTDDNRKKIVKINYIEKSGGH